MDTIEDIAIIGAGGVAGLTVLRELALIDECGRTYVDCENACPDTRRFNIIGFEQKHELGGTWFTDDYQLDPPMPSQHVLNTEQYDSVKVIRGEHTYAPSDEQLENTSINNQISTKTDPSYCNWSRCAVWPGLYTNGPEIYMRHSTSERSDEPLNGLGPFLTHEQVRQRLLEFARTEHLDEHIRFNTEVYNVKKAGSKWTLTLRVSNLHNDDGDLWYHQCFDAVILAQGSYSISFIPHYPGLSEYVSKFPGSVLHSKSYRDPLSFKDKRVLIVGGNISAIDIGQYLDQVAKEVLISRNLSHELYLSTHMTRCTNSFKNIQSISRFRPQIKQIELTDGTILEDIDAVIFATGYHIELPFLEEGILEYSTPARCRFPSSNSRVKGLYQHVFNIEDPTIAMVGKVVAPPLFRTLESQAAAIAGVWTGQRKLPLKQEQYAWERRRLETVRDSMFHKYGVLNLKEDYFNPMRKLHIPARSDPLNDGILQSTEEYDVALDEFERLFFEFKSGKRQYNYDFNVVSNNL